jgi:hypothetical protein
VPVRNDARQAEERMRLIRTASCLLGRCMRSARGGAGIRRARIVRAVQAAAGSVDVRPLGGSGAVDGIIRKNAPEAACGLGACIRRIDYRRGEESVQDLNAHLGRFPDVALCRKGRTSRRGRRYNRLSSRGTGAAIGRQCRKRTYRHTRNGTCHRGAHSLRTHRRLPGRCGSLARGARRRLSFHYSGRALRSRYRRR